MQILPVHTQPLQATSTITHPTQTQSFVSIRNDVLDPKKSVYKKNQHRTIRKSLNHENLWISSNPKTGNEVHLTEITPFEEPKLIIYFLPRS